MRRPKLLMDTREKSQMVLIQLRHKAPQVGMDFEVRGLGLRGGDYAVEMLREDKPWVAPFRVEAKWQGERGPTDAIASTFSDRERFERELATLSRDYPGSLVLIEGLYKSMLEYPSPAGLDVHRCVKLWMRWSARYRIPFIITPHAYDFLCQYLMRGTQLLDAFTVRRGRELDWHRARELADRSITQASPREVVAVDSPNDLGEAMIDADPGTQFVCRFPEYWFPGRRYLIDGIIERGYGYWFLDVEDQSHIEEMTARLRTVEKENANMEAAHWPEAVPEGVVPEDWTLPMIPLWRPMRSTRKRSTMVLYWPIAGQPPIAMDFKPGDGDGFIIDYYYDASIGPKTKASEIRERGPVLSWRRTGAGTVESDCVVEWIEKARQLHKTETGWKDAVEAVEARNAELEVEPVGPDSFGGTDYPEPEFELPPPMPLPAPDPEPVPEVIGEAPDLMEGRSMPFPVPPMSCLPVSPLEGIRRDIADLKKHISACFAALRGDIYRNGQHQNMSEAQVAEEKPAMKVNWREMAEDLKPGDYGIFMLLCGPALIGKSWALASVAKAYGVENTLLLTVGERDGWKVWGPAQGIYPRGIDVECLDSIEAGWGLLASIEADPPKALLVDSLDGFAAWAEDIIVRADPRARVDAKSGISKLDQRGYGLKLLWTLDAVKRLYRIAKQGCHVICTAGVKEGKTGEVMADFDGQGEGKVPRRFGEVGFMTRMDGTRRILFDVPGTVAGTRTGLPELDADDLGALLLAYDAGELDLVAEREDLEPEMQKELDEAAEKQGLHSPPPQEDAPAEVEVVSYQDGSDESGIRAELLGIVVRDDLPMDVLDDLAFFFHAEGWEGAGWDDWPDPAPEAVDALLVVSAAYKYVGDLSMAEAFAAGTYKNRIEAVAELDEVFGGETKLEPSKYQQALDELQEYLSKPKAPSNGAKIAVAYDEGDIPF